MMWRVRYEVLGGHIHCALFAAKLPNVVFEKCGDFVVRAEELDSLREAMSGVEFIEREREQA